MIKTCGHVLCKECVSERIQSRSRKCPHCLKAFGSNDVQTVHIVWPNWDTVRMHYRTICVNFTWPTAASLSSPKPLAFFGESALRFFVYISKISTSFDYIEDYPYALTFHISAFLHTPPSLLSLLSLFAPSRNWSVRHFKASLSFYSLYLGESLIWLNAFGCNEWMEIWTVRR